MAYEIVFTDIARSHYRGLDARWKSSIKRALEAHLRHEPMRTSRSRIKRLHDLEQPQFRLRVDDYRVFYDIDCDSQRVVIASIVPKGDAERWLIENGIRNS